MKFILTTILSLMIGFAYAQFPVGHMSINFKDASRSGGYSISGGITMPGTGRDIGTEVYYPAVTAGNNKAVATGTFPVIVFGHGFAMTWDSYDNVYNRLAALGYIVLSPRTESGFIPFPNHENFGLDLKLLATQGLALNSISTPTALATFNGKVLQKSAIGGHSMGAGASFIAAANNASLTCLFNFAAATTNNTPNSIASASLISVPSLLISGELDSVADTTVQNSHYSNLASTKKFHVIVKGITHCEFGNGTNGTCNIGQSSCGNVTCNTNYFRRYMTYLEPFLEHQLKGSCPAGKQFMDTIQAASSVRVGRKITGSLVILPTIAINGGSVSICNGTPVTLTASGASTYTWTGGVTNASAFTPTATQNYTVTGTDALGCPNTNTTSITVNQGPTITITPTLSAICKGQSINLTASGATTYTWSGGLTNGASVSPTTTTVYTVVATGSVSCNSTTTKTVTVNNPPVIAITPTATAICSGQSINLTASGANTYTWSHAGANGSSVSPTITTNYTVNATSAAGCTNTAVKSISITTAPTINVNSGTICSGTSFTINPTGGAASYTITGGNFVVSPTSNATYSITGSTASGCLATNTAVSTLSVIAKPTITVNSGSICAGQTFTLNPTGATSFTYSSGNAVVQPASGNNSYTVTGSNASGCVSTPVVSQVTVNAIPNLTVSATNTIICAGQSVAISASGANSYTWSTTQNTATINVTPTITTEYTVNAKSTAGCTNTAVKSISVTAAPTINVNSGAICSGESFTINPTGVTNYTITGGSSVVSPTSNATYSITGSSASGCVATNTAVSTVSVTSKPVITINSGSICAGQSFTLNPTGASSYTYSSGNAVVQPTGNSSYTVTGSIISGCNSLPVVSQVTVNAIPSLSISSTDAIICAGQSGVITANGANSYTWSTNENTASITVTPANTTTYTVSGQNAFGCISQSSFVQNVSNCTGINVLNNYTNFGSVHPNPNNGIFNVSSYDNETQLEIYDALGQLIVNQKLTNGLTQFDLSTYAKGIYFVKFKTNTASQNVRVLIQ